MTANINLNEYKAFPIVERRGVFVSFELNGKKVSVIPTGDKDFAYIQSIALAYASQNMHQKLAYLGPIVAINKSHNDSLKKALDERPELLKSLAENLPNNEDLDKEIAKLTPSEKMFYNMMQSGVKGACILSNKEQFKDKLKKLHFIEIAKEIAFIEDVQSEMTTQSILETRFMRKNLLDCAIIFAGFLKQFPEAVEKPKTREWTPRTVLAAVDIDLGF